jgi:hypothetical protein
MEAKMKHFLAIKDQYNDYLEFSTDNTVSRAYCALILHNRDQEVGEVELTGENVKELRDWCDEILEDEEFLNASANKRH